MSLFATWMRGGRGNTRGKIIYIHSKDSNLSISNGFITNARSF